MSAVALRKILGAAILACLVLAAILLGPPYLTNLSYSSALRDIVADPSTADWSDARFQAEAANAATRLGLSVPPSAVRVLRSGSAPRIEVRYQLPVDLTVYTVSLHLRASSGS